MAALIQILSVFVGDPVGKLNRAAGPLRLTDEMSLKLSRHLREQLLKAPETFSSNVHIPGLPEITLDWTAAGQTAGVAVWLRKDGVGAVSLLLCGIEDARERSEVLALLAARRLPIREDINAMLDNHPRPLLVTVCYNLGYFFDPAMSTLAAMLAHAFFAMLGTNMEDEN